MAILLSDNEYAAFKRLLKAQEFDTGRGPRGVEVIRRNGSGDPIQEIQWHEPSKSYRFSRVRGADPNLPANDPLWPVITTLDPCSTGARPAGEGSVFAINGMAGRGPAFDGGTDLNLSGPYTDTVQITTGNTSTSGTGSTELMSFDVSGNGGTLYRIRFQAPGSTTNNLIRIFHQPGGGGSLYLIGTVAVEARAVSSIVEPWSAVWLAAPEDPSNGMMMSANDKIYVCTHENDTINCTGIGAHVAA